MLAGTDKPGGELGPLSLRRCLGLTPTHSTTGDLGEASLGEVGGVCGTAASSGAAGGVPVDARTGVTDEAGPPPRSPGSKRGEGSCLPLGGVTGPGFPSHLEVVCITYSCTTMGAEEGSGEAGRALGTLLLVGLTGA